VTTHLDKPGKIGDLTVIREKSENGQSRGNVCYGLQNEGYKIIAHPPVIFVVMHEIDMYS